MLLLVGGLLYSIAVKNFKNQKRAKKFLLNRAGENIKRGWVRVKRAGWVG